LPPAGTEWIFVAYRTPEGGLGVNICTPHAGAADPTGQSMFAGAIAAFGQGTVVGASPAPPTEVAPALPPGTVDAASPVPASAVVGLALALIGAVAGVGILDSRRRPRPNDRT
jgi:hypothetical protein